MRLLFQVGRMTSVANVLSSNDIQYIHELPEVLSAKAELTASPYDKVYFTISLTDSIRASLQDKFNLDLSSVNTIPMRWIKGDTAPHVDRGASAFQHTYLAYLTDSPGTFTIGDDVFLIQENVGFAFNEGISHETQGTSGVPRLLLGPMNEFAEPVGRITTIQYYTNYDDANAMNGNSIAYQENTYILGDPTYLYGNIESYTLWRIATISNSTLPIPVGVYPNGFDLSTLTYDGYTFYVYPSAPCLLEGTKIACRVGGEDMDLLIETIRPGMLVKTNRDGYKKVELIGKGTMYNPGSEERTENRLYECTPAMYPDLHATLYLTGCHSILVDQLTDTEQADTIAHLGKIFVTSKKYRLMACVDKRARPWTKEGDYTIWHIALENEDKKMNYGMYANGLLVETCSINFLQNKSNMQLQ